MQAAHRVAKNTLILYGRMAITVFISLYSTRLVLAALGVADFGLFNVVGGVISMLGFLNASMAAATQRFISFAQGAGDLEKVKRIFNMSSLLHWGIAILVFIVLEIAGYFFFNGILNIAPDRVGVAKLIYQFMVVSTLFTVISVPYEAVITSHENMMVYAILGIVEAVLKLAIAFYISYSAHDHLVLYGLLMAILSIVLLIMKRVYCHRHYPECELNVERFKDKKLIGELFGFAKWEFLASFTSMLAFYGQTLIINIYFGTTVNAAQAIAALVSGQLGVFALGLNKAINPLIDKSAGAGNFKEMIKLVLLGSKFSFFLLSFMCLPFLIETKYILLHWLKDFPFQSIAFCQLILICNLIDQFSIILNTSLAAKGNIKSYKIITSLFYLSPILFAIFLFQNGYPPYALYTLMIISKSFILIYTIKKSKDEYGLDAKYYYTDVFFKSISVFTFLFIANELILFFTKNSNFHTIISLLMPIIYSILFWYYVLNRFEKNIISSWLVKHIFLEK